MNWIEDEKKQRLKDKIKSEQIRERTKKEFEERRLIEDQKLWPCRAHLKRIVSIANKELKQVGLSAVLSETSSSFQIKSKPSSKDLIFEIDINKSEVELSIKPAVMPKFSYETRNCHPVFEHIAKIDPHRMSSKHIVKMIGIINEKVALRANGMGRNSFYDNKPTSLTLKDHFMDLLVSSKRPMYFLVGGFVGFILWILFCRL